MKPVLCLRHEDPDHLGVALEVLGAREIPVVYIDVWRGHFEPPDPSDFSGVMVLGGSMNVDQTDRFPFLGPERNFIRNVVSEEMPYLGMCLGGQLLARSFGAPVSRSPVRELGFVPIYPTDAARSDRLASVYQSSDLVFEWHEDAFDLPEDAVLLLEGHDVRYQGFRLGDRAWGVQFHPEVTLDQLKGWIGLVGPEHVERAWNRKPEEVIREAEVLLGSQQKRSRALFSRFADLLVELQ